MPVSMTTVRWRFGAALMAVLAGVCLSLGAASAGAKSVSPTCKWAPPSLILGDLHVPVKTPKASYALQIAPVLTCAYTEKKALFQAKGKTIVTIGFRELQHFIPPSGFTYVKGLGSCLPRSCPKPGKPAWIDVAYRPLSSSPYALKYVAGVTLYIEDGLNCLTVSVQNPNAELPIRHEVAQVELLARTLLPKFLDK
jgi:hypothetical protein